MGSGSSKPDDRISKPTPGSLQFYMAKFSPPSRMVWMIVKELDLEVELKPIDLTKGEHKTPEYLAVNPKGTVPAIKDEEFCLGESRAIAAYLCNQYSGGSQIYPIDPKARARVDQLLYISEFVNESILNYINFSGVLFGGQRFDPSKVDEAHKALKICEEFLSKTKFVAANHLTIADFFMLSPLLLIGLPGFDDFDAYPKTTAWMRAMKGLPYFDECNKEGLEFVTAFYKSKLAEFDNE